MPASTIRISGTPQEWTLERIARLSVQDIKQLRENARRLDEQTVAALCSQALGMARSAHGSSGRSKSASSARPRRLIARTRAFEARGVWLQDPRTSWGGLRRSDGAVVMALWADAIQSEDGTCRYLLWAPNVDGSRPWSDQAAGKERLEHCRRAMAQGRAEGLLVYGEPRDGYLPEDKAQSVLGVDPECLIVFQVETRGAEYWAAWGKRAPRRREKQ
ncbi:MAG TPA: hypothetical protein VF211_10585 [Burkholderiales bacterium]